MRRGRYKEASFQSHNGYEATENLRPHDENGKNSFIVSTCPLEKRDR